MALQKAICACPRGTYTIHIVKKMNLFLFPITKGKLMSFPVSDFRPTTTSNYGPYTYTYHAATTGFFLKRYKDIPRCAMLSTWKKIAKKIIIIQVLCG
jgi:hypothetical protein